MKTHIRQLNCYFNLFYNYVCTRVIRPYVDLLFPALCFICDNRLDADQKIVCRNCFQLLPRFDSADFCPMAEKKFDTAFILYRFSESIRILIHLLKYRGYVSLAEYFAETAVRFFPELNCSRYDYILPVPLHKIRLRERGFNQSTILAQAIGRKIELPVRDDIIFRQRPTPSQTKLNRQQRQQNVANAFCCPGDVAHIRILIVDDVITTGSTVNACCQALRERGAATIDVLALANPILPATEIK